MQGDFEAFYLRHFKAIYRVCYAFMRNAADAEDCTEDTFVKAMSCGLDFENERHERSWLTTTAMNIPSTARWGLICRLTRAMVRISCSSPLAARYCPCTGMITLSAAVSAMVFKSTPPFRATKKEPSGSCSDSILFYPLPPLRSWPTISA